MRVLLLLVFTVGFLQSVALLTSATIERNADRILESGGTLGHMREQVRFASRLDPRNIRLLEIQIREASSFEDRRVLIDDMIELEPARAEGWLRLYSHKLRQAEFDDELLSVMQNLARLAPYEPHVHEIVIRQGLDHWFELGPSARRLLLDTAARTMSSAAQHRLTQRQELVTNGGLMPLVCALTTDIDQCN